MNCILDGETRLFPIIGDPIKFVKSPQRLTVGFAAQGHNGIYIPTQASDGDLGEVMRGLARTKNVDGLHDYHAAQIHRF